VPTGRVRVRLFSWALGEDVASERHTAFDAMCRRLFDDMTGCVLYFFVMPLVLTAGRVRGRDVDNLARFIVLIHCVLLSVL
jgi:hypothetical protein